MTEQSNFAGPADFETAIEAAGFGLYNVLLLIIATPGVTSTVFETSSMSYIISSAECDLKLSLLDKGILNAITYAGMITSAFGYGYIADTKGRKMILTVGLLLDSACVLGSSLSQNFVTLLIFKYFGGFLICGTYAVLVSYIAETHSKEHRALAIMLINTSIPVASIILPVLANAILPQKEKLSLWGLTIHSWQQFLAFCALPSFFGGLFFSLLPESPKFLMASGRNEKALKVFSKIYAINKWQAKENYPIKSLQNETTSTRPANLERISSTNALERKGISWKEGLLQVKPLFRPPLLVLSLHVFLVTLLAMLGQNTFRLWLPQLFEFGNEFKNLTSHDGGDTSICTILEYGVNKTGVVAMKNASEDCEVIITSDAYTNNIIVALVAFVFYIVASFLVNFIGVKRILVGTLLICGTSGLSLYFSKSSATTLTLSATYYSMGSIACTSIFGSTTILFPTSLRTMVLSLVMMFGRLSSIFGNILFPVLMSLGCIPPFLLVGLVMYFACILAVLLPVDSKSALK